MTIEPNNTSLWIVNYKRPVELYDTIRDWLRSFPFQEVNVICNQLYPTLNPEDTRTFSVPVNIHCQWQREDWEVGSIAQCWNLAMKKTFLIKDWCIMSQDDVTITPGWNEKINSNQYQTYFAPQGDIVTIQSLQGFKKLGWYDERFRCIGGPENDYLLRAMQINPDNISVHDEHIWQLYHNDIGLAENFMPRITNNTRETRQGNVKFSNAECFERWRQKWGGDQFPYIDQLFLKKDYNITPNPGWENIDWYPSWTDEMINRGRL